jgi:carboxylesterase
MIPAVLGVLAAIAARAVYPKYLERRQAQRRVLGPDGIVVGAGTIDLPRAGAPGVLLLHGGGDTPQVMAALAEHLYRNGFAVRAPLLAGHGRALAELASITPEDWYRDAARELESMRAAHDWVALVGLSMGGSLAIRLASEHADIPAMVLLAPYIDMPDTVRRAARTTQLWGWLFPYVSARGRRSVLDPVAAAKSLGHGLVTPAFLRALDSVVKDAVRALPSVQTPTLVVQSREDNRIAAESAEHAFMRLGARDKQFVWTNGAAHVITVDYGRERVFELTQQWLERHGRRRSGGPRLKPTSG